MRGGLLLFTLACTGCAGRVTAPPLSPPHLGAAAWRITLTTLPAVPRQLDPTQLQVQIKGSGGRPVSGADVKISLVMPEMDMGRNEVTAQMSALGIYTATGRFTMPGDWQVTVQANKGAQHQSQSFPVTVQQ